MSSAGLLADSPLGAVEKADLVLGSFPPDRGCVGVTELARRCGLAKSTTHRVLQVLEAIGMVARLPGGYRLGHRLHELASIAGGGRPSQIRECVLPHLLDLYEQTHLTVHLGVWTDGEVLIADRLHGRAGQCVPPQVGTRVTARSSALGKVMLAYAAEPARRQAEPSPATQLSQARLEAELRTIRQQGIAFCPDGPLPGVVRVAAPVWGPRRSLIAAISVSGHRARFDASTVVRHVRHAASAASAAARSADRSA
jgi:DNA-binding IclR family transcriptional regulator